MRIIKDGTWHQLIGRVETEMSSSWWMICPGLTGCMKRNISSSSACQTVNCQNHLEHTVRNNQALPIKRIPQLTVYHAYLILPSIQFSYFWRNSMLESFSILYRLWKSSTQKMKLMHVWATQLDHQMSLNLNSSMLSCAIDRSSIKLRT